jgi:dipeptidyl aminopeptidase/acylaminoacyl peptidase
MAILSLFIVLFGTVYADEEFSGVKKEILRVEHEAYPIGRDIDFQAFEWSPDGKSIAFLKWVSCSEEFCMPYSFWIMNYDGKEIQRINLPTDQYKIYNVNPWFLRFSPDGKYLLFSGIWNDDIKRNNGLFKLNLQDKSLTLIVKDAEISSADWTPDGNIIYNQFLGGPEGILWFVDSNGNNPKLLYKSQPSFALIDVNPDGNRVLIRDFVGHKGPSTIPNPKIFDIEKNEIITSIKIPYDGYNTLRWSPDGESIIYTAYESGGGTGKIVLTYVDGSNSRILFSSKESNVFDPAPSPDGKSLVFGIDYFNSTSFSASIYSIEFSKPIPEFPISGLILVASMVTILIITRTKWAQNKTKMVP